MKLLITTLLFFIRTFSIGQPTDYLKKYSYYIGAEAITAINDGVVTVSSFNGTGFFIRKKDELYLVTARHIAVPCKNGKINFLIKMFVYLHDNNGLPTEKIFINIEQFLNLRCTVQNKDTDAIVIKVSNPLSVYSVEDFILDIPKKYKEVEIWGYPKNNKDTSAEQRTISNTLLTRSKYSFVSILDTNTNKVDLVNSFLVSKVVIFDSSRTGYSGSPVFIKNTKTKKWVLVGLNWGHGDFGKGENYLEMVRQNIISEMINQK